MIGEILLELVPIVFLITGLLFLGSDLFFLLCGKRVPGKIIAIEKYTSRSRSHRNSENLLYRGLIEFYIDSVKYLFLTGGQNYISKKVGSLVTILSYKERPEFIRLRNSNHFIFGAAFSIASFISGYLILSKWVEAFNFFISFLIVLIVFLSFLYYLKLKLKGDFSLSSLFQTKLLSENELVGMNLLWSAKEIEREQSRNAKVGLIITLVFVIFYSFIFKLCYDKLSESEVLLLKNILLEFKNFNQLGEAISGGPMVGTLFCIMLAPVLFHSILFSLRRL